MCHFHFGEFNAHREVFLCYFRFFDASAVCTWIDGRDAELQAFFTASDRYRLENSSRCGVKSFIIFFPLFQMLVRLKSLLREGGSPKPQYEDYVWL